MDGAPVVSNRENMSWILFSNVFFALLTKKHYFQALHVGRIGFFNNKNVQNIVIFVLDFDLFIIKNTDSPDV